MLLSLLRHVPFHDRAVRAGGWDFQATGGDMPRVSDLTLGVVGITDRGTLIDGGTVNVPEFGFASVSGEYIIEGHGVDPDIEVEQDAIAVINGRDPQLERSVQEVLRLMRENPKSLPTRPTPPVRTTQPIAQ